MHITVFGTGFVGLVTGACLADFGMIVSCVDVAEDKIRQLQAGKIPIFEPGLEEIVRRNVARKRLSFSTNLKHGVADSLALFVCVGTEPKPDGRANLEHVFSVASSIGRHMEDYKVIVIKSTVPVGTAEKVAKCIRESQKERIDFDVVSNPEFLREGAAVEDFTHPNRVVLGGENPRALAIVKDIYRPLYLIETPFITTDNPTAELIKYANNAFLAVKISYINEIARLCDRVGSDVHVVAKAMGLDGRIGSKFLHPGPGFGGSCLPKDTRAFIRTFEDFGLKNNLVQAAVNVNDGQQGELLTKLKTSLGGLAKRRFGLLGLSYKPNTNDIRESPAIELARRLLEARATVRAFDPVAVPSAKRELRHRALTYVGDSLAAAARADAVVVLTEWNEFRNLDLVQLKSVMTGNLLVDARNIYDPAAASAVGFRYLGMGRSAPINRPAEGPGVKRPYVRKASATAQGRAG